MPRRWTPLEESFYRSEIYDLYVKKNLSISEVGACLNISEKTVFQRLQRLGIESKPYLKKNYLKKRHDIIVPDFYTANLAEFFGIMLGDGKLSHFQVAVTLGNKEASYAKSVTLLIEKIFGVIPKISVRSGNYQVIYLGSVDLTRWLLREGLVYNKVKSQVDIPKWIFSKEKFMKRFIRGFFDTDGSIYKLKFGVQIAFTNLSSPLLRSLRKMLNALEYKPSAVSSNKVYITRAEKVKRFFREIKPRNRRHVQRFSDLITRR